MNLTPYPKIYVPHGIERPLCCAHDGACQVVPGKGPDARLDAQGQALDQGGMCWGGSYQRDVGTWIKAKPGWWLQLDGHRPQDLARLEEPRRVLRWIPVKGIEVDHWWRIPVCLSRLDGDKGWQSALDRLWSGQDFVDPEEWSPILAPLRSIAACVPLHPEVEDRDRAITALAIRLLKVAHWIDEDLLAATQWLSERSQIAIIRAALGEDPGKAG